MAALVIQRQTTGQGLRTLTHIGGPFALLAFYSQPSSDQVLTSFLPHQHEVTWGQKMSVRRRLPCPLGSIHRHTEKDIILCLYLHTPLDINTNTTTNQPTTPPYHQPPLPTSHIFRPHICSHLAVFSSESFLFFHNFHPDKVPIPFGHIFHRTDRTTFSYCLLRTSLWILSGPMF